MDIPKNTRLTWLGRARLVRLIEGGVFFSQAAEAVGVSAKTGGKWYRRFKAERRDGLQDRSSRPVRLQRPTPAAVCAQTLRGAGSV